MAVTALDHLYVETTSWEPSLTFWRRLGCTIVEQWGSDGHRAARLGAEGANVARAEVASDPASTLFFRVTASGGLDVGSGVLAPLGGSHPGIRMIQVRDPDGRAYALEEAA